MVASPSSLRPERAQQVLALRRAEISGWFLGAPCQSIHKDNAEEWICWAFFDATRAEVRACAQRATELEELLRRTEGWAQFEFAPGHNPAVRCMRLTQDPVLSCYRPLAYYAVTEVWNDEEGGRYARIVAHEVSIAR